MILLATAEKTGGICMPCQQEKARKEREAFIRENKRDVNLYDGIHDRVQIIKIMHETRPHDPLINYIPYPTSIEKLYLELSEHEEMRLIEYVEREASTGEFKTVESIALELALFRNANLSKLQRILVDQHEYYPSEIFKNVSEEITKLLLNRLESEPSNRNLILLALSWAENDTVVSEFLQWVKDSPYWSSELYIPPYEYSKQAGWLIKDNNTKRRLYLDKSYPLVKKAEPDSKGILSSCIKSNNVCKWCNRHLTNLLEIELSSKLDFIPFLGERLTIATCDACSSYSDAMFMELNSVGEARWSEFNGKPDYLPDDSEEWEYLPENSLKLAEESRPVDYAANEFLPTTFSQIGGMPTWIQDSAYPDCPNCKDTMVFIAQISVEDIDDYGEGMYYNYICPKCNITATNYQQT